MAQRLVCSRVAGVGETAALGQQGVGVFEHVGELLPAPGGAGVEGSSPGVIAGLLCLDRDGCCQRVLLDGEGVGDVGAEPANEIEAADRGGRPGESRQHPRVLGVVMDRPTGDLIEQ